MTSDLKAFAELIEAVRQEQPYVLGGQVWHYETEHGFLCGIRGSKNFIGVRGDRGDVTRSETDICKTCIRLSRKTDYR